MTFGFKRNSKKFGFTLAEVLITLSIIGVVSAITIPSLINNTRVQTTVTKLNKVNNLLSQAYLSATLEYGTPENWEMIPNTPEGAENFFKVLSKFIQISDDCGTSSKMPCFSDKPYHIVDGSLWTLTNVDRYDFTGTDGISYGLYTRAEDCDRGVGVGKFDKSSCGYLIVDVDGPKRGPNTLGGDIFAFSLLRTGFVPTGGPDYTSDGVSDSNVVGPYGWGATWWVINRHNMDYLECPENLNFTDKKSCKK